MNTRLPDHLARTVTSAEAHAQWHGLHTALTEIRHNYPFARAELEDYHPFWVASRFEDIRAIARDNTTFLSGMGGILSREAIDFEREAGINKLFRSVVAMNEPDHRKFRLLTQPWFQPGSVRRLENTVRNLAGRWVDQFASHDGTVIDFAADIAAHYPLLVVMAILGVPEDDEPMMLRLTREYFGNNDEDLNRDKVPPTPGQAFESVRQVVGEMNTYFGRITAARREHPKDDLASIIANAVIDGEPISDLDAMGYYITIAFAGHDTTSSTLAGGLWALAENPDQLALVKARPELIPALVEESIRWTSPIHQFTRIAARDIKVCGQSVRKGDFVVLSFPSGNRDESVFADPFSFRVDRPASTHVGFGYGAHMCLGMHLARLELRLFFEALLPRIDTVELAGTPRRTITNFVGGPKSVPIRCRFSA